jgi:hypothetical protein
MNPQQRRYFLALATFFLFIGIQESFYNRALTSILLKDTTSRAANTSGDNGSSRSQTRRNARASDSDSAASVDLEAKKGRNVMCLQPVDIATPEDVIANMSSEWLQQMYTLSSTSDATENNAGQPPCGRLRRYWPTKDEWTSGDGGKSRLGGPDTYDPLSRYSSDLAREIHQHQSNCSLPYMLFELDNSFGIGSHLHLWSQAFCNAWEKGHRVRTYRPQWLWRDEAHCKLSRRAKIAQLHGEASAAAESAAMITDNMTSPWECYFGDLEPECPNDTPLSEAVSPSPEGPIISKIIDTHKPQRGCQFVKDRGNKLALRQAAIEYFFHQLDDLVVAEAQRQIGLIFNASQVPENLITVHVRWGDKFFEMKLASIQEYIDAVNQVLAMRVGSSATDAATATTSNSSSDASTLGNDATVGGNNNNSSDTVYTGEVNIYLATEDPKAADEFKKTAPSHWNIYYDLTLDEINSYRPVRGNRASYATKNSKGRAGLVAFGSLLVALEANDYVLTTGSGYSRIMNYLRQTMIDPQCGNCTRLVDVRPGEW